MNVFFLNSRFRMVVSKPFQFSFFVRNMRSEKINVFTSFTLDSLNVQIILDAIKCPKQYQIEEMNAHPHGSVVTIRTDREAVHTICQQFRFVCSKITTFFLHLTI